jgi:hypothetical protein
LTDILLLVLNIKDNNSDGQETGAFAPAAENVKKFEGRG